MEQALEYVRASMSSLDATLFECPDGSEAKATSTPVAVAGVLGGSYSGVSIQVRRIYVYVAIHSSDLFWDQRRTIH